MSCPRLIGAVVALLALCPSLPADSHVAVVARARPDYVQRRTGPDGRPKIESYVFLQGNYLESTTVNRSLERMPFRRIAEFLASELSRQQFFPARSAAEADLLIVVHWGATRPHVSALEMSGRTSLITDNSADKAILANLTEAADSGSSELVDLANRTDNQLSFDLIEQMTEQSAGNMTQASNAVLLGYNDELHRLSKIPVGSAYEQMLHHDLTNERYFVILKAYDLKPPPNASKRALWTMHLNIGSPGNNFEMALTRMSMVAARYAGQSTDTVQSVRTSGGVPVGTVTLGELVILGEAKRN